MWAVRPQIPHRSPRQAFGGNSREACLRQALAGKEGGELAEPDRVPINQPPYD